MATSQYNYNPFHTIGAATVLIWDEGAGAGGGAWRPLGKAAEAAVIMTTEQVGQDLTLKGLTQPIARRNRSKRYSLAFRLLENAGPQAQALLFGEGGAQAAAGVELAAFSEALRLYGQQWRELSHPYGIINETLPGATGGSASAGGTGGSIPPGTYYYWVVTHYADGDVLQVLGEPLAVGSVAVGSGQKVTFEFGTHDELLPLSYFIYANTTNQLDSATYAGSLTGTGGVLASHAGGAVYAPEPVPLLRVTSLDGAVEYAAGADYLLDAAKGLVKRLAGGALADGGEVLVTYAYARPASVLTPLGDPVDLERYRRVKLLQLAADDPDPALWRETGVEFTFYKVCTNINDSRWPFTDNDFSEGCAVVWDCLFDGAEAKVGTVRSTYSVLAEYV